MSQYAIIFQVLGGVLALFFIFLTVMNVKTWRWHHVTMTFLVFAASVAFCVYAAMAMKTRLNWVRYHDKKVAEVETAAKAVQELSFGKENEVESKESVVALKSQLALAILDRGRVWRHVRPTPNADGTITISTEPPADPNLPAAAPKPHNITPKTMLFAFREGVNDVGDVFPVAYLGEYRVRDVAENSVTLQPALQTPEQAQLARDPNVNWVIYEVCPIDGHEWFAGISKADMEKLIPMALTGLPQAQYDKLIEQYTRDGGDAVDTDPPENVWVQVKFLKDHVVTVDAAGEEELRKSVDTNPFNANGLAVLDRVRSKPSDDHKGTNPGEVKVKQGQTALLDQTTANQWIADGVCALEKRVFRRRLNDYELRFHAINRRAIEIVGQMQTITLDKAAIEAATARAMEQEKELQDLQTKLKDDLAKAEFERDELAKYLTSLETRLTAVQAELSQLYRSNKALSRELSETSAKLTKEIEERTRKATASK